MTRLVSWSQSRVSCGLRSPRRDFSEQAGCVPGRLPSDGAGRRECDPSVGLLLLLI